MVKNLPCDDGGVKGLIPGQGRSCRATKLDHCNYSAHTFGVHVPHLESPWPTAKDCTRCNKGPVCHSQEPTQLNTLLKNK